MRDEITEITITFEGDEAIATITTDPGTDPLVIGVACHESASFTRVIARVISAAGQCGLTTTDSTLVCFPGQ